MCFCLNIKINHSQFLRGTKPLLISHRVLLYIYIRYNILVQI